MKTILVPTDFSKNADNALDYAVQIAKKTNSKIILLHVFYIAYYSYDSQMDFMTEQSFYIQENTKNNLVKLCDRIKQTFGVECDYISKEGFVVDSIISVAEEEDADMIIMGTKGASGLKKVLMGSNTAKVIGRTSCTLIAVPEKASYSGIQKIVYATDYNRSDVNSIKLLVEFAEIEHAEIKIIHVVDGENKYEYEDVFLKKFEEKVKKKINYKDISCQLVFGTDVEKKLEQYLKKESVNFLGISTKNRNLFKRFFGKSITRKLVYHTKIPLIVFHHK